MNEGGNPGQRERRVSPYGPSILLMGKAMKEISFRTWPPETQLNLPGTVEPQLPRPMLHFQSGQMVRHRVRFTLWNWLRGAGDWGVTAELTGELKQGEEPEQLPAAPRRPPQTSGTAS